jgi:predicted nucleotide-binding protein (sugar kinase/HSP70/actin superfamily)
MDELPTTSVRHYQRPFERPFLASERSRTTILFGGLTQRHEQLIQAGLEGCGYTAERLPAPDFASLQLGREYGNSGQCNPAYFTIGSLLTYLRALEAGGLTRQEIADRYVYFTAGSCGPCRFGMYESEYRLALHNAGFDGFRVLLFQQDHGVRQAGPAGLQYSVDFGLRMTLALQIGDVLNDLARQIRPYEVQPGTTDRVLSRCVDMICATLREPTPFDVEGRVPAAVLAVLRRYPRLAVLARRIGVFHQRFHGDWIRAPLEACRREIAAIEVDRLRPRPVVKITGEFWAQTTEGDGNYRMFDALEREGAEVFIEPVGSWVTYLTSHARRAARRRYEVEQYERRAVSRRARFGEWRRHWRKVLLLALGERLYIRYYRRVNRLLGGIGHELAPQCTIARLAAPFYSPLARGGEGHLEIGKTIYYTLSGACHMVLSLKPFGCMPSAQSDGVQSAVVSRYPEILFVPIETSGDAEINALSRMQMALCDARAKARDEFDRAVASTGRSLADITKYVAAHPELRRALYPVPRRRGLAGTGANFVRHLADRLGYDSPGN